MIRKKKYVLMNLVFYSLILTSERCDSTKATTVSAKQKPSGIPEEPRGVFENILNPLISPKSVHESKILNNKGEGSGIKHGNNGSSSKATDDTQAQERSGNIMKKVPVQEIMGRFDMLKNNIDKLCSEQRDLQKSIKKYDEEINKLLKGLGTKTKKGQKARNNKNEEEFERIDKSRENKVKEIDSIREKIQDCENQIQDLKKKTYEDLQSMDILQDKNSSLGLIYLKYIDKLEQEGYATGALHKLN